MRGQRFENVYSNFYLGHGHSRHITKDINHCNQDGCNGNFPISIFGCTTTSWRMKR